MKSYCFKTDSKPMIKYNFYRAQMIKLNNYLKKFVIK